jgi:hypothetical protein
MPKQAAWFLLSFLTGAIFIFSAYAKLYPVELFEYTFVDLGLAGFGVAPWVARFFIGLEFAFGLSLIFSIYGNKQWILKANLVFMTVLSGYLVYIWIFKGNDRNCGCFGQMLDLSPAESLLKNLLMISGLLLLWIFHEGWKPRYSLLSLTFIGLVSLVTPFILNPVGPVNSYLGKEQIGRGLILDSASVSVRQELSKGKDLVAFLSLTCSHCRIAGYKLHILKEKNPSWPIFMILNGDKEDLKKFYRETYTENVPYEMMTVKQGFMSNSGPAVPAIFLTEEGVIKQRINYLNLSEDSLALWFDKLNQGAP